MVRVHGSFVLFVLTLRPCERIACVYLLVFERGVLFPSPPPPFSPGLFRLLVLNRGTACNALPRRQRAYAISVRAPLPGEGEEAIGGVGAAGTCASCASR